MTLLEQVRKTRGMSQKELAAGSGVDQATISRAEKGEPMGRRAAARMAAYLGHPYEEKYFIYPERYLVQDDPKCQQVG